MKLKRFNEFNGINEELHPDTYMSAAEKLKKKGHSKRAKELTSFKDSLSDSVQSITIDAFGKSYTLGKDNIRVEGGKKREDNVDIFVVFDPKLDKYLSEGNMEGLWNSMSDSEKTSFINDYKEFKNDIDEETISDEEKETLFNSDYSSLTQNLKGFFDEYSDMNQMMIHFGFSWKSDGMVSNRKFYRDGLIIEERKNAFKILKLLKNYGRSVGGEVESCINMIGVNDMYEN